MQMVPPVPYSTATTPEGVMSDMGRSILREQQNLGGAPASLGITRPGPDIRTGADMLSAMDGWKAEQTALYGGRGHDMADTKAEGSYSERRWQFLSAEEGSRAVAYDDATGKPIRPGTEKKGLATIGVGFNMDRPEARKIMNAALGITDAQFDKLKAGEDALEPVEIRKLFEHTADEAEAAVVAKLKGVPLREHQRLALTSLAFNSPKLLGPKITQAVASRNWGGAVAEILDGSNAKRIKGLGARRWREASMFAGPATSGEGHGIPPFDDYMQRFA